MDIKTIQDHMNALTLACKEYLKTKPTKEEMEAWLKEKYKKEKLISQQFKKNGNP